MKSDTIYHLEIMGENQHRYYGSISAIYEDFDSSVLKVSRRTLYNFRIDENRPYQNKVCIIRKGTINRKKQTKQ